MGLRCPLLPRHGPPAPGTVSQPPARPCEYRQQRAPAWSRALRLSHGPWQPQAALGERVSILEDLLMFRLCHQMVTARGHSCAEPQWDAEARDATESSSLPGMGMVSPIFCHLQTHFLIKTQELMSC